MDQVTLRSWLRRMRAQSHAHARFVAMVLMLAMIAATDAKAADAADAPTTGATENGNAASAVPGSSTPAPSTDRSRALQRALTAVVGVETVAIEDAGSVATLGQER